VKKLYMQLQ